MRLAFQELLRLGPLPPGDALDEQSAQRYETAIRTLPDGASADEAVALVDMLPSDDSTAFGLAWSVLHAIEASPAWPLWDALDDRNWWVSFLRDRCAQAGLHPPPD
ncbi:hypothetical protein KDN32_18560 [Nocardioides sp. J2M5]|uniref:hypothetical protein n=1 Tax=Nocardioides palaemonis TaxID=2829810 RepID=UPI001BA63A1B|nr:hypothetical protein [Nocardioides palaemonis]MBS2939748.1 hypothetical protein [Nocardioides palaemonis]